MALEWWQMPGPAQLVEQVVRDLEEGNCAVVYLPRYAPPDFRRALRRQAERPHSPREWHFLNNEISSEQPLVSWLWEQWHSNTGQPCPLHLTIKQLLSVDFADSGGIWELPSLGEIPPLHWLKFLDDYQREIHSLLRVRRNVLVLVVEDSPVLSCLSYRSQAQLVFHTYKMQPSKLDMLLFLNQQVPAIGAPQFKPEERELRIHSAAALYPTDPLAAIEQAENGSLNPAIIIGQIREQQKQRDWLEEIAPQDENSRWVMGMVSYVDGQIEHHLGAPHEAPLEARIRQALWLAQVRVLLPWMEYQRWRLLHKPELKRYLQRELEREPFHKKFEGGHEVNVTEPEKLEPSHILSVIKRKHPSPHPLSTSLLKSERLHRQLAILIECRNALSHLSPLSEQLLVTLLDAGW